MLEREFKLIWDRYNEEQMKNVRPYQRTILIFSPMLKPSGNLLEMESKLVRLRGSKILQPWTL